MVKFFGRFIWRLTVNVGPLVLGLMMKRIVEEEQREEERQDEVHCIRH